MIDRRAEHLTAEDLGVLGPGDVQLIQRSSRNPDLTLRPGLYSHARADGAADEDDEEEYCHGDSDQTAAAASSHRDR